MDIIITTMGGLGLFIFGMNMMGSALQKAAGSKLRDILALLTKNRFLGILVGTLVSMVIQSSSATTVMVIGFVNAGLMNLSQAIGVIMGANIGTTVTSQIIAFKLTDYAPVAIAVGVAMNLIFKSKKKKDLSEIVIGFGLLFVGMNMMGDGLKPLSANPIFMEIMSKLENPVLAMFTGFALTTLVQSSSASIGILQALAAQNLVSINIAFPILFGENIGTTTTALISSIGANKNAKRAALMHFFFNVFGTLIFMLALQYPIQEFVVRASPFNVQRQIANAHTLFNLINVVIQAPFAGYLVKLVKIIIPGEEMLYETSSKYIDKRMIGTPSIATSQILKELERMFTVAKDNLILSNDMLVQRKYDLKDKIDENEKIINALTNEISEFVVELSKQEISEEQNTLNNIFIYSLNDIERIGDHVVNISETAQYCQDNNILFSEDGTKELQTIFDLAIENINITKEAFGTFDVHLASQVYEIEENIDRLEKQYKDTHIKRLSSGICDSGSGVMFLDAISNLERVSDHCTNIANYILENSNIRIHI